jgi:hypothetical protein
MGKIIAISVAVVLQVVIVLAFHVHFTNNPKEVIVVVDSSFGLTKYQNTIVDVIEDLEGNSRYQRIHYGTDKNYLGEDINIDTLFKVNFGKMNMDKLKKLYPDNKYDLKYLLIFTDINEPKGWEIINLKEK